MKYNGHFQNQKIIVTKDQLTLVNPYFGIKWLDNETVFVANLFKERATIFSNVWSIDFFANDDILLSKTRCQKEKRVDHLKYQEGKWHCVSSCEDYIKVGEKTAIISLHDFQYLCNVPSEKALTIPCDKMQKMSVDGETLLLVSHELVDSSEIDGVPKGVYVLEYFINEYGQKVSLCQNTFRHVVLKIPQSEIYFYLEEMKKDCLETLLFEKEKPKRLLNF